MDYLELRKSILNQVAGCFYYGGDTKYPIGEDFYVQFFDGNEWGDTMVENMGVRVIYNKYPWDDNADEVFTEYRLGEYMHGVLGNLVFHGSSLVDDMVTDILKDCYCYVEEEKCVSDNLPF